MTTLLLVGLASGLGAVMRYLVDRTVRARWAPASTFPWGILVVNVTGSFALGLVVGLSPPGIALTVAGVGFLGSYTTFSTFAVDTLRLAEDGAWLGAAVNVAGSVAAGLLAAAAGIGAAAAVR